MSGPRDRPRSHGGTTTDRAAEVTEERNGGAHGRGGVVAERAEEIGLL